MARFNMKGKGNEDKMALENTNLHRARKGK